MNLFEYLQNAKSSLFRFEGLQEYNVGEENDEDMEEWWNFIEQKSNAGVVMERVRLIVLPLNEYIKDELLTHRKSAEKGDNIKVLVMTNELNEKVGLPTLDFWLVDNKIALIMNYDETGGYLGFTVDENIESFLKRKDLLLKASIPISQFVA